jgi:hypothetical protein
VLTVLDLLGDTKNGIDHIGDGADLRLHARLPRARRAAGSGSRTAPRGSGACLDVVDFGFATGGDRLHGTPVGGVRPPVGHIAITQDGIL